jgi:nucleotide-binding universal stress UspA family protein
LRGVERTSLPSRPPAIQPETQKVRAEASLDPHRGAAAECWHEIGYPYEAALALADGDEAALREALAVFDRLGARPMRDVTAHRLRKLGVPNRVEAARYARRNGVGVRTPS